MAILTGCKHLVVTEGGKVLSLAEEAVTALFLTVSCSFICADIEIRKGLAGIQRAKLQNAKES